MAQSRSRDSENDMRTAAPEGTQSTNGGEPPERSHSADENVLDEASGPSPEGESASPPGDATWRRLGRAAGRFVLRGPVDWIGQRSSGAGESLRRRLPLRAAAVWSNRLAMLALSLTVLTIVSGTSQVAPVLRDGAVEVLLAALGLAAMSRGTALISQSWWRPGVLLVMVPLLLLLLGTRFDWRGLGEAMTAAEAATTVVAVGVVLSQSLPAIGATFSEAMAVMAGAYVIAAVVAHHRHPMKTTKAQRLATERLILAGTAIIISPWLIRASRDATLVELLAPEFLAGAAIRVLLLALIWYGAEWSWRRWAVVALPGLVVLGLVVASVPDTLYVRLMRSPSARDRYEAAFAASGKAGIGAAAPMTPAVRRDAESFAVPWSERTERTRSTVNPAAPMRATWPSRGLTVALLTVAAVMTRLIRRTPPTLERSPTGNPDETESGVGRSARSAPVPVDPVQIDPQPRRRLTTGQPPEASRSSLDAALDPSDARSLSDRPVPITAVPGSELPNPPESSHRIDAAADGAEAAEATASTDELRPSWAATVTAFGMPAVHLTTGWLLAWGPALLTGVTMEGTLPGAVGDSATIAFPQAIWWSVTLLAGPVLLAASPLRGRTAFFAGLGVLLAASLLASPIHDDGLSGPSVIFLRIRLAIVMLVALLLVRWGLGRVRLAWNPPWMRELPRWWQRWSVTRWAIMTVATLGILASLCVTEPAWWGAEPQLPSGPVAALGASIRGLLGMPAIVGIGALTLLAFDRRITMPGSLMVLIAAVALACFQAAPKANAWCVALTVLAVAEPIAVVAGLRLTGWRLALPPPSNSVWKAALRQGWDHLAERATRLRT